MWRITRANDCFLLYWHMNKCKKKYLAEMNSAPAFFQLCNFSLQHTAIIELQKFYDSGSSSSLESLLNVCENHKRYFRKVRYEDFINPRTDDLFERKEIKVDVYADIQKCRQMIRDTDVKSKNLKGRRDRYYAHLDSKYRDSEDCLIEDFPLTFNDITKLFDVAAKVCNMMLEDLCGETFCCNSSNVYDIDNLLEKMNSNWNLENLE